MLPDGQLRGLVPVGAVSFSCLLIPTWVLQQAVARWHHLHFNHPDCFFSQQLADRGVPMHVDCEARVEHRHRSWREVPW